MRASRLSNINYSHSFTVDWETTEWVPFQANLHISRPVHGNGPFRSSSTSGSNGRSNGKRSFIADQSDGGSLARWSLLDFRLMASDSLTACQFNRSYATGRSKTCWIQAMGLRSRFCVCLAYVLLRYEALLHRAICLVHTCGRS